jgi:hypothetical protein
MKGTLIFNPGVVTGSPLGSPNWVITTCMVSGTT